MLLFSSVSTYLCFVYICSDSAAAWSKPRPERWGWKDSSGQSQRERTQWGGGHTTVPWLVKPIVQLCPAAHVVALLCSVLFPLYVFPISLCASFKLSTLTFIVDTQGNKRLPKTDWKRLRGVSNTFQSDWKEIQKHLPPDLHINILFYILISNWTSLTH